MKTPAQVAAEVRARLEKRWHLAIAAPSRADWPFRCALGAPAGGALEADFQRARAWARNWEDWASANDAVIDWRTRLVRGTTQPMPSHVEIRDINAAARIAGQEWPARIARGRHRLMRVREGFPQADHAAIIRAADSLPDADFTLLLEAAQWFACNSAAGLTPRQVPLPGFHGKWLNANQALIRTLTGRDDLGLNRRPTRVHFTYLDPEHRAAGRRHHESLTIGDTAEPAYQPEVTVILENKDTAVYFPPVPMGISVEGEGGKAPGAIPLIPWIRNCPHVIYWGDIDAAGLAIVNDLRSAGIEADTILMDYCTYEAYEQYGAWTDEKGRPVPCAARRNLTLLTPDEHDLYLRLTDPAWTRVRRVEQERIPLGLAAQRLASCIETQRRTGLRRTGSA
ncbi:Wadjet anti-phage system protein JetD domain-containing protein [Trebonia kvetii]|uniref:Wadjet anti-phage system protein JetD domain-containing protein n=1 Tax=Trebonia kvetii TaxID=2480626 RepID=UPI001652A3D6|nr:Wadjet anti-phage system protein JetD domain-containing protein [Trebonia kvetii]